MALALGRAHLRGPARANAQRLHLRWLQGYFLQAIDKSLRSDLSGLLDRCGDVSVQSGQINRFLDGGPFLLLLNMLHVVDSVHLVFVEMFSEQVRLRITPLLGDFVTFSNLH